MLCEHCKQREANVSTTSIIGGVTTQRTLCAECFEADCPEAFAKAKAMMEAGCRYCGAKCGAPICERCLAELQRVMKEKGVDPKKTSLSEDEKERNAHAQGMLEVIQHMRKWAPNLSAKDRSLEMIDDIFCISDEPFAPLVQSDSRFTVEAYKFVATAVRRACRLGGGGHASGREVALAFRDLALQTHGKNALKKFVSWGIFTTDDIGTILCRMTEARLFGARPEDKIEDFHAVYDFATAFPEGESEG